MAQPGIVNVAIGVLIVGQGDGERVLIARRPQGTVLSGLWEFPGGKIEAGESPQACVAREFREEVGLAVEVGQVLPVIEHQYPHGLVRLHPFMCALAGGTGPTGGVAGAESAKPRPISPPDSNEPGLRRLSPSHPSEPSVPAEVRWVRRAELVHYPFPPANTRLIADLMAASNAARPAPATDGPRHGV